MNVFRLSQADLSVGEDQPERVEVLDCCDQSQIAGTRRGEASYSGTESRINSTGGTCDPRALHGPTPILGVGYMGFVSDDRLCREHRDCLA